MDSELQSQVLCGRLQNSIWEHAIDYSNLEVPPLELKMALESAVTCGHVATTDLLLRHPIFGMHLGILKNCVCIEIKTDHTTVVILLLVFGPL